MFWQPTPTVIIGTDALDAIGEHNVDFVQEFAIEDKRFTELRAVIHAARKHNFASATCRSVTTRMPCCNGPSPSAAAPSTSACRPMPS